VIGGFLGGLAGLGRVNQGFDQAYDEGTLAMLRALQLRQAQQDWQTQQQAVPLLMQTLRAAPDQQAQIPPELLAAMQGGAQPEIVRTPLGPPQNDGMATGLPSPTVRGSWFGNAPGWSDPSVGANRQASGLPQSAPGIALPTRAGLGQQFDLTTPEGRTVHTRQTDVGPAAWTGRGVDVNAALASQLYPAGPRTFPTDGGFRVSPGGGQPQPAFAPEHHEQARSIVGPLLASIPAMFAGRMTMPGLARLIEQNSPPGTSEQAKFAALQMASHLMQPQDKEMMTALLSEARLIEAGERLDISEEGRAEQRRHDVAMEAGAGKQGTIVQQEGHTYRVGPAGTQPEEIQFPGQGPVTRVGSAGQQLVSSIPYPDKWAGMPDKAPPGSGIDEATWRGALFYARTNQMPTMGIGSSTIRSQIYAAAPAASHALGIKPSEAADVAAGYAGERHGEIVAGGRAGQLSMAINEARAFVPRALAASKAVNRTQFPTLNTVIEAGLRGTGDENIVALYGWTNALANVAAQIAARQGAPTDLARTQAINRLNEAYSKGQFETAANVIMQEAEAAMTAPGAAAHDIQQMFAPPALKDAPAPTTQAKPGKASGGAPLIKSIEEFNKLGEHQEFKYLDPDGNIVSGWKHGPPPEETQ